MTVEAPTQTLPRSPERCPRCGAPADEGQLVCLDCGGRLALDYRRPTGWKPAAAIVGIVVLAAGAAFGITLAVVDDDAEDEIAATPAEKREGGARDDSRESTRKERRGAKPARRRSARERRAARRQERRSRPPRGAARAAVPGWPKGRDGFTVVLLSAEDARSATAFARKARRGGVRAGVLRSDGYSSLPKGFWIVFAGVHRTRAQAERAAERLGGRFEGAFPQLVKR